jgi:prevent-host-death family protein
MATLSLASARADLSRLVDSAVETHERFEVTRNGNRVAVLLSAADFDSLTETLEILADKETMDDLRGPRQPWEDLTTQSEMADILAARLAAQ